MVSKGESSAVSLAAISRNVGGYFTMSFRLFHDAI